MKEPKFKRGDIIRSVETVDVVIVLDVKYDLRGYHYVCIFPNDRYNTFYRDTIIECSFIVIDNISHLLTSQ